jgi:hypothetical protein
MFLVLCVQNKVYSPFSQLVGYPELWPYIKERHLTHHTRGKLITHLTANAILIKMGANRAYDGKVLVSEYFLHGQFLY